MKAREERLRVVVPVRLHANSAWLDATILNMSSRGLMLTTQAGLKRGDYVEIRRGTLIIIARVIWAQSDHAGLRAQDQLDIPAIVNEPRLLSRSHSLPNSDQLSERRREASRAAAESLGRRAERSRNFARAAQFITIGGGGAAAGVILVGSVGHFLMGVSATIQAALSAG